jgi:hypothetical protein
MPTLRQTDVATLAVVDSSVRPQEAAAHPVMFGMSCGFSQMHLASVGLQPVS